MNEQTAKSARALIQTKTGPFALYDFRNQAVKPSRMVAALAVVDGNTWFFKMLGEPDAVSSVRADLIHLVESVHVE